MADAGDLPVDQIVCGDNVETLRTFPDDCIDLVVTSPPYDNLRTYGGHEWDFEGVAQQLWRVIKPGGVVVWVVADATIDGSETGTSFRQALRFKEIGFRLHDTMIYIRDNPHPGNVRYKNGFEFMFVLSKGPPTTTNIIKDRPNVYAGKGLLGTKRHDDGSTRPVHGLGKIIADNGERYNVWWYWGEKTIVKDSHPAIFPEALARDHILSWSNEGDIVLDPFSGSGTTAKMAKHNGRKYIGIEVNAEYCEIAHKRLAQQVLF